MKKLIRLTIRLFFLSLVPLVVVSADSQDFDNDGVANEMDNCIVQSNIDQLDSDFDGFGDRCDSDLNNDNIINLLDVSLFASYFLSNEPVADFNSDGVVNFLDLYILSESFLQAPGPSGTSSANVIYWTGDSDDSWANAQNWSSGAIPTANDIVIIDNDLTLALINIGIPLTIRSLYCAENLFFSGGTITFTEKSVVNGAFLTRNDTEIFIESSTAKVEFLGDFDFDDIDITVSAGALLRFTGTQDIGIAGIANWTVEDTGSRIEIPDALTLTLGSDDGGSQRLSIDALRGGVVSFSALMSVEHIRSTLIARIVGNGSSLLLPSVSEFIIESFSGTFRPILFDGGRLYMPRLANALKMELRIDEESFFEANQLTSWVGGSLDVEGAAIFDQFAILERFEDVDVRAVGDLVLSFPGIESMQSSSLLDWVVTGSARLVFTNLQEIFINFGKLDIALFAGGVFEAPLLHSIVTGESPGNTRFELSVSDSGSMFSAPELVILEDNDSTRNSIISVTVGGSVVTGQIAHLNLVDLAFDSESIFDYSSVQSWTNSNLRLFGGKLFPPFSSLTNFDESMIKVSDGAQVSLAALPTYRVSVDGRWESTGEGSVIKLPSLVAVEIGGNGAAFEQWELYASDGGSIEFASLLEMSAVSGPVSIGLDVHVTGVGSKIAFPMLSTINFDENSFETYKIRASNEGELLVPVLASAGQVDIRILDSGILNLAGFTSLTLDRDLLWSCTGIGSVLSFPNLEEIVINGDLSSDFDVELRLIASGGGSLDLPVLDSLTITSSVGERSEVNIFANSGGSVSLPLLRTFRDEDADEHSSVSILNNSTVYAPLLTEFENIDLELDNLSFFSSSQIERWNNSMIKLKGGQPLDNFDNLFDFDDSSIEIRESGFLSLPAVTSINTRFSSWDTTGATISFPNLVSITLSSDRGDSFSTNTVKMDARFAGLIDLPKLETLFVTNEDLFGGANISVTAEGTSTLIRMPTLVSWIDNVPNRQSSVNTENGGDVIYPNTAIFENVIFNLSATPSVHSLW